MRERDAERDPGCEPEGEVVEESKNPDMAAAFCECEGRLEGDKRKLGEDGSLNERTEARCRKEREEGVSQSSFDL